jgi:hypothetical protein
MEELLQQSANGDQSLAMPKSTLERPINSENPATIGRSGTTSIEEEINQGATSQCKEIKTCQIAARTKRM